MGGLNSPSPIKEESDSSRRTILVAVVVVLAVAVVVALLLREAPRPASGPPPYAANLHLSPDTIRSHVRNSMAKTGAHTRAQLVALVLADGLIED